METALLCGMWVAAEAYARSTEVKALSSLLPICLETCDLLTHLPLNALPDLEKEPVYNWASYFIVINSFTWIRIWGFEPIDHLILLWGCQYCMHVVWCVKVINSSGFNLTKKKKLPEPKLLLGKTVLTLCFICAQSMIYHRTIIFQGLCSSHF